MITGDGFKASIDLRRSNSQFYLYDKRELIDRDQMKELVLKSSVMQNANWQTNESNENADYD